MTEDNRTHPAQSTEPTPEGWPKGVRPIGLQGVAQLGVDDAGRLYWAGRLLSLRLGGGERAALWIGAGSAALVGLESLLNILGVLPRR